MKSTGWGRGEEKGQRQGEGNSVKEREVMEKGRMRK